MNSNILYYQSIPEVSNISVLENLPENIDVFSNLKEINNAVGEDTLKSYNRLIETIKRNLSIIDNNTPINNNLSKIMNFVDEDKEVELEWIVKNTCRIGFIIDVKGNISFWQTFKDENTISSYSKEIINKELDSTIYSILNEVLNIT